MSADLIPRDTEPTGERPLVRQLSLIVSRDRASWEARGLVVWTQSNNDCLLLGLEGKTRFGEVSVGAFLLLIGSMSIDQYRLSLMRADQPRSLSSLPSKGGVQVVNGVRWEALPPDNRYVLEDRVFKTVEWVLRGQDPQRKKGR
jgi:hypothetical protein